MNKKRTFIFLFIFIILSISYLLYINRENVYINTVLVSKDYAYLPQEAKEYIKEVYAETKEIIHTEKNKETNQLYLNPQYISYLSASQEERDKLGELPIPMILDYTPIEIDEAIETPTKYDLRNVNGKNYITPVRNQGNLGICWTFATAGAVESHLLKQNNSSYSSSSKLISERQLDYLTSKDGIKDYTSEYMSFYERNLGDGGNFYISTIAIANGVSLIDYNSFKSFNDRDLSAMELSDVINYKKSQYEVNTTFNFPILNVRESTSTLTETEKNARDTFISLVKLGIMDYGAAYVGTYMDNSCVYKDTSLNNVVIDVYNCSITGGHAMQIIGWDDDIEYSYCADTTSHNANKTNCKKVVSGKGVWILKNSWGNLNPYPYLTYDSLYSTISFVAEIESTANKKWDNNYVLGGGSQNNRTKTYSLSDTKLKDSEDLKKIKFITEAMSETYTIKILKKDGTYATLTTQSSLPGLVTVDVPANTIIDKNSKITIESNNSFIDRVSIFTSNVSTTPYIDIESFKNKTISEKTIRLYSNTKNIPSDSVITYKMYNKSGQDVSSKATFTNNKVAENNINTLVTFSDTIESGTYRIDVIYNSNVINTFNFTYSEMKGLGTRTNPYIITNSDQLYQIRDHLSSYYELANDIDLTEDTRENGKYSLASSTCSDGFGWESINNFAGSLDGKGHTIKGLYQKNYLECQKNGKVVKDWNNNGNGLFGTLKQSATIKNIVLENFDITCQGGYCGALVSKYNDSAGYTSTFENIAIKNSKITGTYNSSNTSNSNTYGGGLFGNITSAGSVNISNIYLDINQNTENILKSSYLVSSIQGENVNIQNIHLLGNLKGKYSDGSNSSVLINTVYAQKPTTIKNILSLTTITNVDHSLIRYVWGNNLTLKNINILRNTNNNLCASDDSTSHVCTNATNLKLYNKNTQVLEFTKSTNYNTWDSFNNNWIIKTVDGITRTPVLKFMNFEYTSIPNITINQVLNESKSIYDYITPKSEAAKRIIYKSNNENIVTIDEKGKIIPKSSGNTTIHVESLYDGYIKDVPITITYKPHYTINFNANGGTGEMASIEVSTGTNYRLPTSTYTKEHYTLSGWNTKADGTGTSYNNLSTISAMADKTEITLYAQWTGEEIVITFNPDGGTVTPASKTAHYGETYGDLPIPTKRGYAFEGWIAQSTSSSTGLLVDSTSRITSTNLIASWRDSAYTIIYDANGGEKKADYSSSDIKLMSRTTAITSAYNNINKQLAEPIFEKNSYGFKEWNTKADGTGTSYTPKQVIKLNNVDNNALKLYAIWTTEKIKITFNANNGTNTKTEQQINYYQSTKLNKNTFTREEYTFKEWNTKADGTGTSYKDEQSVSLNTNLTLYAIWEEPFGYRIKNYSVDTTNNYISKIMVNTTVNSFKNNIELNTGYSVTVDSKNIYGANLLYTGGKTNIYKGQTLYASFTNVVIGDVNGDGKINSADLLKIRQHLLRTNVMYGAYFLSSDVNYDMTVNSADLLRVRQHLLEIKPIT